MKRLIVLLCLLSLLAVCRPTAGSTPSPTIVASPEPTRTPARTATLAPKPPSASTATPTVVPTPRPSHTPTPTLFVPQPPNDNSYAPRISADGRYVAFVSWADNLVEGDTNERQDVFVYDRYTGRITRVSVASDGTQSDGVSGAPAISAYGHWIAFASEARSLAPNQMDWEWNVFVHEPRTGRTEQITQYASSLPSLSADGRYLALVGTRHIYVHDRQTGQSECISTGIDGTPGNGQSTSPAISTDGRYVAFWSWAGNLVDDDERVCEQAGVPLSCGDVFVYDRRARTMERIPVGEGYGLGGGGYELSISADGRWVVFRGILYDRQAKTQSSFCGLDADAQSAAQTSVMSADGRWITFSDDQVYLCDRTSGKITQVSTAPDGTPGDGPSGILYGHEGYSGSLDLSADGRWLVFTSQAGNLMPGRVKDSQCQRPLAIVPGVPHCYDVYLYDRETRTMSQLGLPWSVMAMPAPAPTPLPEIDALAAYVPVIDDAGPVMETLFAAVARWLAYEQASQEMLSQAYLNARQAEQFRARRALEIQRELQRTANEIVEHRRMTHAEMRNDSYLMLTGQKEYVNPYTNRIDTASNEWSHRWVTANGEEFYTDDESFNPNHDERLNRIEWQHTPVRSRDSAGGYGV